MHETRPARHFVDSNVWIYALVEHEAGAKKRIAKEIIRDAPAVLSTQVISEVCANLLRRTDATEDEVTTFIRTFYDDHIVVDVSRYIFLSASQLRRRYSLSYWDSLIVASALSSGAPVLLSEDMQDGLKIDGGLTIKNPFAALKATD